MRIVLDVDLSWLTGQRDKIDKIGGYTVGLVIAYGGNKILLGKTQDDKFIATAEYEDADGSAKNIIVRGRSAVEVVKRCSSKLHRIGVIAVK